MTSGDLRSREGWGQVSRDQQRLGRAARARRNQSAGCVANSLNPQRKAWRILSIALGLFRFFAQALSGCVTHG